MSHENMTKIKQKDNKARYKCTSTTNTLSIGICNAITLALYGDSIINPACLPVDWDSRAVNKILLRDTWPSMSRTSTRSMLHTRTRFLSSVSLSSSLSLTLWLSCGWLVHWVPILVILAHNTRLIKPTDRWNATRDTTYRLLCFRSGLCPPQSA